MKKYTNNTKKRADETKEKQRRFRMEKGKANRTANAWFENNVLSAPQKFVLVYFINQNLERELTNNRKPIKQRRKNSSEN